VKILRQQNPQFKGFWWAFWGFWWVGIHNAVKVAYKSVYEVTIVRSIAKIRDPFIDRNNDLLFLHKPVMPR
jgi:hypothetical protein